MSVDAVEVLNAPCVAGQPVDLDVRLRNYGPVRWAGLPLTVTAGSRTLFDQKVNLAPDSTTSFRVTVKDGFAEPGTHVVSADINRQHAGQAAAGGAPPPRPRAARRRPRSPRPSGRPGSSATTTSTRWSTWSNRSRS